MERVIIIQQQQQGWGWWSSSGCCFGGGGSGNTSSSSSSSSAKQLKRLVILRNGSRTLPQLLLLRRRIPSPPISSSSSSQQQLIHHQYYYKQQQPPLPTPIISPSSSSSSSSENNNINNNNNNNEYGYVNSLPSSSTTTTTNKALALGTVALLSTILLTVIHPIIAPPAFATFQTVAAKAGAPLRTELLTSAWTGFFAGCLHTLSGPDHLAALAPLSIGRTRMESAAVGALWGCGHDAGQVIFGLLFLVLKDRLHIEIIRTWGTRVVGLTLLVIGAMGIKEAREAATTPCVVLENGECDVSGTYEDMDSPTVVKKKKIGFATFATGVVHGLQPDALMMVLPALALPSRLAGAAFLGMFLVGTVISMGSYTVFIGSCSQALKERVPRITEKLTWASSLVAIAFGLAIIISQYFGFNLY